jgi:hypothetical protein
VATLLELQDRRDRLLLRLESMQKRVSHGDKTVEYSLEQSEIALKRLDREITRSEDRRVVRHVRIRSFKDL